MKTESRGRMNYLVSLLSAGWSSTNPFVHLRDQRRRDLRLIVDPRRTELARPADVGRPRVPGTDVLEVVADDEEMLDPLRRHPDGYAPPPIRTTVLGALRSDAARPTDDERTACDPAGCSKAGIVQRSGPGTVRAGPRHRYLPLPCPSANSWRLSR